MSERIEGVPVGVKLARIGIPKRGEWIIDDLKDGVPIIKSAPCDFVSGGVSIIVPDNVYGVIDLSTVPIPEGWERDGDTVEQWFRIVDPSSPGHFLADSGDEVLECSDGDKWTGFRIHVRRIKPKTRRVLIREWDLTEDEPSTENQHMFPRSMAQKLVAECPSVYRIEERPL